jgi:hypothetical protein
MYRVEARDERDRWKSVRINPDHATLEHAKHRVTSCDPDGFFDPNMRIIGPDGFVYGFYDWHAENRSNAS